MSNQIKNILTAAVALLAFAAFVALGTRDSDSAAQKRLNALEAGVTTSTTIFDEPSSTTTTLLPVPTTTATTTAVTITTTPPSPVTTVKKKKTTTTTVKRTGTTSRSPATTAASRPHNGPGTEASDNQYQFTLPGGTHSADPSLSPSDPFAFVIKMVPTSANEAQITVQMRNNTDRAISFPGDLTILVTVSQDGSPNQTYSLHPTDNGAGVHEIRAHETLTATPTTPALVVGAGTFTASATCDVDFGS